MIELIEGVEEMSACCSAGVAEYNASGTPRGVPIFSRCSSCHEMAAVIYLTREGKEVEYHDVIRNAVSSE
jgi:hypothetical protein